MKESEELDIIDIEDEKISKNITRNFDRIKSMFVILRKLDDKFSDFGDFENNEEEKMVSIEGFRLIDIFVFVLVFELFWCSMCKYGYVTFEDCSVKMGFVIFFVLKCIFKKCKYSKRFFFFVKIEGS